MNPYETTFIILYFLYFILASVIRVVYSRRFEQPRSTPDRTDRSLSALPIFGMLILPLIYGLTSWLDFANYTLPAWTGCIGAALFGLADW